MRTVLFGGKPVGLSGTEIRTGVMAPDFTVVNGALKNVKLSDYDGKIRVIAVYPSIDTGVCQAQNRRFNAEASGLTNTVILSVSCDLPFAQKRFCAAEGLNNVITLSDHRSVEFGTRYGFLIEELRLLARGTVVIDAKGVVQYVEYVPDVSMEPDYEAALKVVRSLI
ncbi:MAG: thiol peroxidase [Bacteroidales bacterium]|jgi:thiol peroxidase|nr:thiol peroxidase [Bacteroidales bacterium]HNY24289.1 thiol peroxidase [Bacteroidales bacterium]